MTVDKNLKMPKLKFEFIEKLYFKTKKEFRIGTIVNWLLL